MSNLNHEYKHIFIHVPRTAGTSMHRSSVVKGTGHDLLRKEIEKHPDYFTWGFVRFPPERLISGYSIMKSRMPKWARDVVSFEKFILNIEDYLREKPFPRPMTDFLCDAYGKVLVDFVGRYENLQTDWEFVCEAIGVGRQTLAHHNKVERPNWREVFTEELLEVVERVYHLDYEVFGYEKS